MRPLRCPKPSGIGYSVEMRCIAVNIKVSSNAQYKTLAFTEPENSSPSLELIVRYQTARRYTLF